MSIISTTPVLTPSTISKKTSKFQKDEQGNLLVPSENLTQSVTQITESKIVNKFKKEITAEEKQRRSDQGKKLAEMRKNKFAEIKAERDAKEHAEKEARIQAEAIKIKEEVEKKLAEGKLVRVQVKAKKAPKPKLEKIEEVHPADEEDEVVVVQRKQPKKKVEVETESEDEVSYQKYKEKTRNERIEAQKKMEQLAQIDKILAERKNPYLSKLMERMK